ncbi:glycosyltransferase [Patescibacteria group bacterium]|nr:glycosyltransferase [Patescibacteria group bacterium]
MSIEQKNKKILYIVTIPDWGGAQKYVADLACLINKDGFDIVVSAGQSANFSKINLLENCKRADVKTYQFDNLAREINPIKDILALWDIKKYIDSEKPDYIHLNSSKVGILGSFAVALSKYKPDVWYTVHGWVFNEPMANWRKKFYIFLERWASRYRDKIIVLGEKEKQIALEYKICPGEKLQIRKQKLLGMKLVARESVRKELGISQDKKIIGTIANLYPAKGLNYLIEAAKEIPDNCQIAIIGDGPERKKLELLTTHYKLQTKIILLGEKENAAQYLSAFDVFVLPSIKEGAPYTILEAMEAKLPIIATDVGSVSEMLKNYPNKTIIPPADIKLLTQEILDKILLL